MATDYELKKALPNKSYNDDGTTTDLLGNEVINPVPEYANKPSLPNKWLNPDGSYSTLLELISGAIDTELFIVVEELPAEGLPNKIYLLVVDDKLIEYCWVNNEWNPIGMVEFDVSQYSTTDQMNAAIAAALNSAKAYADAKLVEAKSYTDVKASTAETNAKSYADGLASNYDPAGSASSAETAAKAYADTKKSEAISSSNGYTDTAIQTSITQVLGGSY